MILLRPMETEMSFRRQTVFISEDAQRFWANAASMRRTARGTTAYESTGIPKPVAPAAPPWPSQRGTGDSAEERMHGRGKGIIRRLLKR